MTLDIVKVLNESRSIQKYNDPDQLHKDAVPYIGQPKQHKDSHDKVYLRLDYLSGHGVMIEFKTSDILYAEDYNTISQKDGAAIRLVKLWVKKGSLGIKLEPFYVNDYSDIFST